MTVEPPETLSELESRARALAGRTLGEVAAELGESVPRDLKRHKGWAGQIIELALGATAGNRPVPDFEQLGVELKTLPVDGRGRPLESTYVCMVQLTDLDDYTWEVCVLRHKLAHVLWVPLHAEREIPVGRRMIGTAISWSPDAYEIGLLRADWQAHMDVIRSGWVENIRGEDGEILQVRPKGASGRSRAWAHDDRGEAIMTMPRGFYLRPMFTEYLLTNHFG